RAAFLAAAERAAAPRRRALACACRLSDRRLAARCPSRRSAPSTARARVRDVLRWRFPPLAMSRFALARTRAELVLLVGSLTPAGRASDRPIAIACFVDRAPCLPPRMWCISSRTNSPAWVEGDLPLDASRRARSIVRRSGIIPPSVVSPAVYEIVRSDH